VAARAKAKPTAEEVLEVALGYRKAGWNPLLGKVGEKKPMGPFLKWRKFQSQRSTPAQLRTLGKAPRNVLLVTGSISRLLVIDCDDAEAESYWRAELGSIFDQTTRVRTSRGFQYYFRLPEGAIVNSRKNGEGTGSWDLQAERRLVAAPPSVHASGSVYEWVEGHGPESIRDAPMLLLGASPDSNGSGTWDPLDVDQLLKGVDAGGRDDAAYKYACRLRSLGNTQAEARVLMESAWQAMDQPPGDQFTLDDALKKVERAWQKHPAGRSSEFGGESGFDIDVKKEVRKLQIREAAQTQFRTENAGEHFKLPRLGWTLEDELALPVEPVVHRVEGLQTSGGNVLLVASYKAGKTVLTLNLAHALADGVPFLDKFKVEPIEGRIAVFNYELTQEMWNRWARDIGIANPERVVVAHLRGSGITPIWEPEYQAQVVEWMRANKIKYWISDPAGVAWLGLIESEGDNIGAARFTSAIDEVKKLAGVEEACLTHHTGRAEQRDDEERARGATRLEDWMDAGWYLTADADGQRFLRARGRDVHLEPIGLAYEEDSRRYSVSGLTKEEARASAQAGAALAAVIQLEEEGYSAPSSTKVKAAMKISGSLKDRAIKAAEKALLIKRVDHGPGKAKTCESTQLGRRKHGKAVA
jgi:hypothetical protein